MPAQATRRIDGRIEPAHVSAPPRKRQSDVETPMAHEVPLSRPRPIDKFELAICAFMVIVTGVAVSSPWWMP